MKTISIVAEKGGVAKTTTAQALTEALRTKGFKVLAIDLDSQENLTYSFKATKNPLGIYEALDKDSGYSLEECIKSDFLRASDNLGLLDKEPANALKDALKRVNSLYDYCIIDTPPKLDKTLLKALISSNYVVIPTKAEAFSVKGVEKTLATIEAIKERANKGLKIAGLLITFYNSRSALNTQLRDLLEVKASKYNTKVFKTAIRKSIAISKAQAEGKPLFTYIKEAKALQDYTGFIKELLKDIKD